MFLLHFLFVHLRSCLVGNKTDLLDGESPSEREVPVEEAIEYAKSENIDYIETSALSGENVDAMFRRISLSVGRLLPQVAVHLEVSYLPDGWMACFDNTNTAADSGAASGLSVSDISAALEDEVAKQLSPPAQRTKSPLAAEAATLKQIFLNYWTGEIVTERPTHPAPLSPGLLYVAKENDANNDPRNGGLKERTSSCKTSATFRSSSSNGTNNGKHMFPFLSSLSLLSFDVSCSLYIAPQITCAMVATLFLSFLLFYFPLNISPPFPIRSAPESQSRGGLRVA